MENKHDIDEKNNFFTEFMLDCEAKSVVLI